ncbi:centrosomal protein of 57 kDa-like, partial [Engraulis encrasicolus]|uniref:centrosomal protein of 57 kDa-like n=1 Tax=Engraulis encrasicolus TaxID=184585 RepID=UPI002FD1845A
LQTGLEANRILLQSVSPRPHKSPKTKKKKKSPLRQQQQQSPTEPHYRLSLRDVPFVTGTSTGTSHSVRANVQHVLNLLKHHNPQLCNSDVLGATPLAGGSARQSRATNGKGSSGQLSSSSSSSSSCEDLSELLGALQQEFGNISLEHQECVRRLQCVSGSSVRMKLEREQETLLKRMEDKGEQIAALRRHQAQVDRWRRERKKAAKGGQVRVVTTVTGGGASTTSVRNTSPRRQRHGDTHTRHGDTHTRHGDSLQLLRDMRSLQSSLQTH